ncbi:hypothetical protein BGZ63DRAFT_259953 [Mariannaea sp. PMI_226]|nr:hypothetical protein BGZ63DRAFT_259953 [Mariannaea sp. PMI_226]
MGAPFTDEEKRFLLAEIIKTSQMDIDSLSNFIRANGVEPNWMQMQLPLGRNMSQSMNAADKIGFPHRWMKRKVADDYGEPGAKRMSLPGTLDPSLAAAPAPTHVPILPRPKSGFTDTPAPSPTPAAATPSPSVPKKKGRPARADRAKLKANLPPTIAPRPVEQNQSDQPNKQLNNQSNSQPNTQQGSRQNYQSSSPQPQTSEKPQSANNLRPLLPANAHGYGNYGASYVTSADDGAHLQALGMQQDELMHPRIMVEPTHDQFGSPRPAVLPGLVPLEPEPRASNPGIGGTGHELTTLPPMLDPMLERERERESNSAYLDSPRVNNQSSVANSI